MAALVVLADPVQVRILAPQLTVPSGRMRTCVRAAVPGSSELRGASPRSRRRVVRRGAAQASACGRGRQLAHAPALRGSRCGTSRSTTSIRAPASAPRSARAHPRPPLDDAARPRTRPAHAATSSGGSTTRDQAARCELCGQGEEWRGRRMALILDHINGDRGRQPAREPADRLPELRRDARHPLRAQRQARGPALRGAAARAFARRAAISATAREAAGMRSPRRAGGRSRARGGCERPPYEQSARGGRGAGLVRRRTEVRRQRQRGAQVDAGVRARARGAGGRLRVSSGRRRLVRRPPRLALFMRIRHARRRGRGPSRARCSGVCGRSDDAAVAGAGRACAAPGTR